MIHPRNPYVPTSHANVRFFVAEQGGEPRDLVVRRRLRPDAFYPFGRTSCIGTVPRAAACEPFGPDVYPRYKRWCDNYFFLKHRNETRGVGGLFFDDLNEWGFDRVIRVSCAASAITMCPPICRSCEKTEGCCPTASAERNFQLYRRGRYVEFNLVYDRGTCSGCRRVGGSESILMSLPPLVRWEYDYQPEPDTPEARLYSDFLRPRDWLAEPGR